MDYERRTKALEIEYDKCQNENATKDQEIDTKQKTIIENNQKFSTYCEKFIERFNYSQQLMNEQFEKLKVYLKNKHILK